MRITELLEVENVNVHLDERYLIGGKKTDAGKNRVIPINKKILPFIKARYNPENKYLINFEGKPVTYTTYIRKIWQPIMQVLEMDYTPHECRHTSATLMDNAEPPINELVKKKILRT